MKKGTDRFYPSWRESPPEERSYRSIFKWGSPNIYKHPNAKLYSLLKSRFDLNDSHFINRQNEGDEKVSLRSKINLKKKQIDHFKKIAGKENVSTEEYDRLKYSTGKTTEEALMLRHGIKDRVSDLVIHPRSKNDIIKILQYCRRERIPVYPYGAGSSVNFGIRPSRGGISLVMSTHMNRVLEINEINQTATVEAGIGGPQFEETLNNAPAKFNTKLQYTCGHFPQSFEFSTVGGWISALGSGQMSTYYGDASDMVISQEYITPSGIIKTHNYPAAATGPDIDSILIGSEGAFGILVEATLKIYRYMPQNRRRFSFMFPSWENAASACREISQAQFGFPALFRLSDPEETDVALKLYNVEGTILDSLINLKGYKPMERCLLIGSTEGEDSFSGNVKNQIKKVCKKFKGIYMTGYPVKKWEHGRYTDPYMREDLLDYGIIIDTLETSVTWDKLDSVHKGVRDFIKGETDAICMSHCSHFYMQGTNLYFIIIMKETSISDYRKFLYGIVDQIVKKGGSLSHHHGIGKMLAPWMEKYIGKEQMGILRTIKKHLDPKNIMNPGGQLGLDLPGRLQRKL